jgi:hypothetical protein
MLVSVFDRQNALFRSTFAACVVSALVLIWAHRFLPMSDYPDWMYEGSVAAELLQGKPPASYTFKHYPVPYAGTVALLGLLDFAFPPEVSGKVVLSLSIILLALSSTYLLKSLRRDADNPLLLIPLLFLFNTFFFWGELNYILGLSLFFLYCGYLFRRIYRSEPINWWFAGSVSIALFFCHFLPYATAVLVTLILCFTESRTKLLRPFAISFAPSIGLTIWYAIERWSLKLNGPVWEFWTVHQMAGHLIAAFSPFPEFLPWLGIHAPGMKVFALLNLLVAILLTFVVPVCVLFWAKGRTRNRGVLACAVVCALAVVVSGYEFAGMLSPGERFIYPAIWIGLCWLIGEGIPREGSVMSRGLTVVLIGLLACQILFLRVNVGTVSNGLAALYSKLRSANSRTEFCAIYETYTRQSWDEPHRTGFDLLLTNHASAPRVPYYLYLEDKVEAPIFQIGILSYKGHGDNEDLCKPQ